MTDWGIYEVEWLDHAFHAGPWQQQGLSTQYSVGYLLRETNDTLVLSQSVTADDGDDTPKPCEVLVLGRSMVVTMRKLT